MISTLYITYDGILEPLGQSQVLGYLRHLARDRTIHLISFEKPHDWADTQSRERMLQAVAQAGIVWHPLRYHKRPSALATAYDIFVGLMLGLWLCMRHRIKLVHARSYVPAVVALGLKAFAGCKFIFDMRGFWADERVDGGLWPRGGVLYRVAKRMERRFLLAAAHIVSLTRAAVREMERFPWLRGNMPPTTVIPTCADLDRFRPAASTAKENRFTLGYVGSAGTWYLFDQVIQCFSALQGILPQARLLVINRGDHDYIRARLAAANVPPAAVELRAAAHGEVPALMQQMDAGIFFYKPSYSRLACAPTKLGEFLGCGIPCIANAGVGDMRELLEGERVGVVIDDFDDTSINRAWARMLELVSDPSSAERCTHAAKKHFSLMDGVAAYERIYRALGAGKA